MTVARGEAWGAPGPLPSDGVVVRDDAAARFVVRTARATAQPVPVLGLLGGDLCRTVGGHGDEPRLRSADATTLPVDLGLVWLNGEEQPFVAHVVARRSWWRGRVVAVMNAQYLDRWDVAPRGHPNDGRLDVVDVAASLGVSDRLKARRRLPHGLHVPHPAITERRVVTWSTTFEPALRVWVDGEPVGECRELAVRVEPDALTVVV